MPRSRPAIAVLMALLVALSGCSAIGGSDSPTVDDVEGELPPGLSTSGVENASALADAHTETLSDGAFVTHKSTEGTIARNGEEQQLTVDRETEVAGDGAFRVVTAEDTARGTTTTTTWSNGTVGALKASAGENTQYRQFDPTGAESWLTDERTLYAYLASANYSVENVTEEDGRTLVTLNATEYVEAGDFGVSEANVSSFQSTAVVDLDGQIHAMELSMAYAAQGQETEMSVSYESERADSVDVDRPDWADEAFEKSSG